MLEADTVSVSGRLGRAGPRSDPVACDGVLAG